MPARAYQIASGVSDGCHESITAEALRRVRRELEAAAPLPPDRNERALIDDLEFMQGEKTEQEFEHIINALLDGETG